jgi:hypothetical protein
MICNLLSTFWDNLSVPSSRSSSPLKQYKWTASHLKMGPIVCPKTSVTNIILRCIKFQNSEVSFNLGRSLKSQCGCVFIQGPTTGSYVVLVDSRPHLHILLLSAPSKYYPLMYVYVLQCYLFSVNPLNKIFHMFLLSPTNTTAAAYTRGIMLDQEKPL